MIITNPSTEETIKEIQEDSADSIRKKFESLKAGQKKWADIFVDDRIDCIGRFLVFLEENRQELAETLTLEVGKPLSQSFNEIKGAAKRIKFFTDHSKRWLEDEWVYETDPANEKISYEPLGVIANISAWNYPYLVGVNVFIPALIAGNAVLYKPSEHAMLTGLKIGELLHKAGIPEDVFAVVSGGPEAGETLLDLPLDGYFFTGSNKTGQHIISRVAAKLVPVQLELGGKDPVYVMEDVADVKKVAEVLAEDTFYNNGQSCCAVERLYIHKNIYDEFTGHYLKRVKAFKTGNPMSEGVYIGPLTRKEQIPVLEEQVRDALDKGAKLLAGGKKIPGKGHYFEPTVLADVTHEMKVMREESFGPVIGIMKVDNDEQATELMQDTDYGLTAGIFSKSRERAEKILKHLNTGTSYWNCCDRVSPFLPWSGRKASGLGSTLSYSGIRVFTKQKAWHFINP